MHQHLLALVEADANLSIARKPLHDAFAQYRVADAIARQVLVAERVDPGRTGEIRLDDLVDG